VKDFFGLQMGDVPAEFHEKLSAFAHNAGSVDLAAAGLASLTVVIVAAWPRVSRRVPGTLIALLLTTALVQLLHLDVQTIGSRFGEIKASFPSPSLPHLDFARLTLLVGPALTIALLASIESLLSAVVADGMIGTRHNSNRELIAQGFANIASPLFGGIPATGAIARTAANVRNGGRTPVAGIAHAITLLIITIFFARWAGMIPMAALAGILVTVAWHMSGWRTFLSELRAPRSDVVVLLLTFGLTVIVDLTVAIEVGMVAAAFLFMRKMAEVTHIGRSSRLKTSVPSSMK
jgi:SulP family sulfate permease